MFLILQMFDTSAIFCACLTAGQEEKEADKADTRGARPEKGTESDRPVINV
jgi:hypothetical protein